jgi:DNA repair exonuclease SbcCD ATPase subunit
MIKINRLKLDIQGYNITDSSNIERFGFDIPFSKGLNVIKGENTSGKSTIISCLLYSLGLEEILGVKYDHSLDNSLKREFSIDEDKIKVHSSYLFIEIENTKNDIVTIKRSIVGNPNEKFYLKVFEGKMSKIDSIENSKTLFIHRERNHESEIGYFKWFSEFIGFPKIPKVLNQKGEYTDLYIQTIFPALLIEQTKGWSDFLSSIPYFSIKENKQRTIEYLLNLKALKNEVEKEKLTSITKKLIQDWKSTINKMNLLATSSSGKFLEISEEPLIDSSHLKEVNLEILVDIKSEEYINIQNLISNLDEQKQKINLEPKFVKDTSPQLKNKLEILKAEYLDYIEYYKEFTLKFQSDKYQIISYENHLKELKDEIEVNKDIKYLTEKEPSINELANCPTCHQEFGSTIIKTELSVEFKTIKGNLAYLKDQEKLLVSSIENLKEILIEKTIIDNTFSEDMSALQSKIKQVKNELLDPDLMPSRSQIFEELKLENEINHLTKIESNFNGLINELKSISEKFNKNRRDIDDLVLDEKGDEGKINNLETTFKNLLRKFKYSSNDLRNVTLQKKFPFKYLPVTKYQGDIQKIQLSSSASDFIRSIWAYTISLLINAENHPGILLFDEPSQHSMKSSSLKEFFETLSNLNDYQIIIAASTDEHAKTEDKHPYSINNLLTGLKHSEYKILDKAIRRM